MSKLTDLRKKFASGMERGYITSDDWRDEVLPMLEDAERFRIALGDILNPIARMQRELKEGERLSGMAYSISESTEYLKSIAKEALDAARKTTNEG